MIKVTVGFFMSCIFHNRTPFDISDETELLHAIRTIMTQCGYPESTPLKALDNARFFLGDEVGTLTIGKLREVCANDFP
jgi:hypothetical protein